MSAESAPEPEPEPESAAPSRRHYPVGTSSSREPSPEPPELPSVGAAALKTMAAAAFSKLQGHEQQQGHPSWVLNTLLAHAPLDAQVWDILGHTLKACRAAGIPPAVGGVPGKQLLAALYAEFCEQRGPLAARQYRASQCKSWQWGAGSGGLHCALGFD